MSATQKIKMLLCEDIHDGLSLTSHFDFSSLIGQARKREHFREAIRHQILSTLSYPIP